MAVMSIITQLTDIYLAATLCQARSFQVSEQWVGRKAQKVISHLTRNTDSASGSPEEGEIFVGWKSLRKETALCQQKIPQTL